jgi:hypothetical protein
VQRPCLAHKGYECRRTHGFAAVPYRRRSEDFRRSEGRTKKRKRPFPGIQFVGFQRREAGS